MLFLIVLPVMGAASYWSKVQDRKYHENIKQNKVEEKVEKTQPPIETVPNHHGKMKKAGINPENKPNLKSVSIIQELNRIRFVCEVFSEERHRIEKLAAKKENRKKENKLMHNIWNLYESFNHYVTMAAESKMSWTANISLRHIFNHRHKTSTDRFKVSKSTAVTLWESKEPDIHDVTRELDQYETLYLQDSKPLREETKLQVKSKYLLSDIQIVKTPFAFTNQTMIDPSLINYIIQQRLDELVWMGIYYSLVLANSNLNKVASVG